MQEKQNSRILVVDDEGTIREILQRTLEAEGHHVVSAMDAAQALTMMDGCPFDLVLSDIMMPGMSGVELLKEIKVICPDTAIIMVTAVADTQTAINAMKQGASDYVTKPFNLVEVILSVDRALEKKSLLMANREYRMELEDKVAEQTEEIRTTFFGAVKSLAEALEAKDPYTNGHSKRVTELAVILACESGISKAEQDQIRVAGLVHDIGKIGVPEAILHKPDRLTEQEYDCIKEHPAKGERILKPIVRDPLVLSIVLHHHESFAGGGYPEGISGEEIPVGARIMSVADAYDAMTSSRPYRSAMHPDAAKSQLLANRGSQFDPEVVDLFLKLDDKMPFCPISAAPAEKSVENDNNHEIV